MEYTLNPKNYILVIEDEVPMSDLICYSLKREDMYTIAEYTGKDGLERLIKESVLPQLVILDLMLPDMNGYDICKEITSKYLIPVIILTSKTGIIDKVRGLEIGADDYITKPFDVLELSARVKALLRRTKNNKLQDIIYLSPDVSICRDQRKVVKNNKKIELTPKEYELLLFLASNSGKVFSREILLSSIWGYDYIGDSRTVDIHIGRLRKKLDDSHNSSIIETVFGVGYMLQNYISASSEIKA